MSLPSHVQVAVIGAGFSGLCTAIKLKESGREDFVVLERGDDVGGTWRDNTYPGAACDVPSHLYSFSFAPNPGWTRSFSPQPEILTYLQGVARDHDVLPHCRFGVTLLSATWVPEQQHWALTTSAGDLTADVVITGAGALSDPAYPDLKGLSTFEGTTFHSARWDHTWTPAGRRIAVIGTGASAIQFVPEIAPEASRLTVFQRTAPWVLPRVDRGISAAERSLYRRLPALQRLVRTLIYWARESQLIGFRFHRGLLRLGQRLALGQLHRQVEDPALREKVTPHYDLGCKRVLLSSTWYPALTRPNVDVATDRIVEVVPTGIVTEAADGARTTHHADTIVFGTGFHPTDPPIAEHVYAGGRSLAQLWATAGMQAHRGLTVAGFPNLFFVVGPNTGLGHNSMVLMIEAQVGHVIAALDAMRAGGFATIEPREAVQDSYNRRLQKDLAKTVWATGGCRSWYVDAHGRNTVLWPTFSWRFIQQMRTFQPAEYLLGSASD